MKRNETEEEGEAHHLFVARKIGTSVRGRHYSGRATKNPDGTYEDKANDVTYEEAASSVTGVCSTASNKDLESVVVDTPKCATKKTEPPLVHLRAAYNLLTSLFDRDDNKENVFTE